jgi:apolipoprotein N-acyltransferase
VQPREGDTPYLKAGNWPIVGASALALIGVGLRRRRAGSVKAPSHADAP